MYLIDMLGVQLQHATSDKKIRKKDIDTIA